MKMENEIKIEDCYKIKKSKDDNIVFEFLSPSGFPGIVIKILDMKLLSDENSIKISEGEINVKLELTYDILRVPKRKYNKLTNESFEDFKLKLRDIVNHIHYKILEMSKNNSIDNTDIISS